jgi:O-antigen/teichoic acid export membrane protein
MAKGLWAVMDQGLFATSNFVLNIFLARWLTPADYGAFAMAFAIFLFVGSLHQATLLEPMLVFGPGRYKERLPEYLGVLIYGHLGFAAIGSLALLSVGLVFALWDSRALSLVMFALAAAGPFILLLWLMRRACYARLEPRLAASGGAWYMLLMLAGTFVLYQGEDLSAASAVGVMGISSLAVSLWLAVRLGVRRPPLRGGKLLRECLEDHWRYGRWSVANQALNWIPMNIYYIVLPIWGGLGAGAAFKALMNLVMPMLQGVWALSILALPALVRARDRGQAVFDSQLRYALIPFVLCLALYWVVLGLFHYPLVSWLYGDRYTEYAGLLWILGLSPAFAAVKQIMGHSLRALERPDWLFLAYMLSAAVTLSVGTGLMYLWGIAGAGIGLLMSQAITAALALIFYRRLRFTHDEI